MSGYLVEATNEIRRQAEAAEGLADDLENPAFYPRTELRDLLAREFQQDLSNGRALWLETVMDDIAVLVTRHYAATARELADELGELVYDSSEDEEEERQRLLCLDCGENTIEIGEFYMVKDDVWAQVCEPDGGMLCIGCLEERLGRRLVPDDFKDCQLHHHGHLSERLRSRLRGAEEAPAA
jgi:hypothetical protein